MRTALITGANKGIGFETARQLLEKGFHVFLGSRNVTNGIRAAEQLKSCGFTNVEMVQIDVTDEKSVENARIEIGKKVQKLDFLINNAGISGIDLDNKGNMLPQNAIDTSIAVYQKVYNTNVYGPARVTKAFIDLLEKSDEPRIVNLSSSQGSLPLHSDPKYLYYNVKGVVYLSSKAALNMYTINLAYELRDTKFKVNAVSPGFTSTDFTGKNGGSVQIAAERVVKYALIGAEGPTGKFFCEETNSEGGEIPW